MKMSLTDWFKAVNSSNVAAAAAVAAVEKDDIEMKKQGQNKVYRAMNFEEATQLRLDSLLLFMGRKVQSTLSLIV